MNLFDGVFDTAFDVVTNTMGYDALWFPSSGGSPIPGRVLFNDPAGKSKVGDTEYRAQDPEIEYKEGVFPGLKAAVDQSTLERIEVNGRVFHVTQVNPKYDGKNYVAILVPIS